MKSRSRRIALILGAALILGVFLAGAAMARPTSFKILRPVGGPEGCLENARGEVAIRSLGPVEVMTVGVKGLPPRTTFDLFVLQLPREPFGIAWYQGDIRTDAEGRGEGRFIGRFSEETFAIAPDVGSAPVVHDDGPFPDASSNPEFAPIHMHHLGLWFNSRRAAEEAGCPDTITPFNGKHRAGIKALSTRQFPDDQGPLRSITP